MSELEESFTKLLGRQPSDQERQGLYRVKDALGLHNNDALWLVLIALQHYEAIYAKIPEQIAQSATEVLTSFQSAAEQTATAAAQSAKVDLAKAVATASHEVARNVASRQKLQWVTFSLATCCLLFCGTSWVAYMEGNQAGELRGYERAKDDKAAASWATTATGQLARRLAVVGSIELLGNCTGRGWKVVDGICYPQPTENGIYGWRIPPK